MDLNLNNEWLSTSGKKSKNKCFYKARTSHILKRKNQFLFSSLTLNNSHIQTSLKDFLNKKNLVNLKQIGKYISKNEDLIFSNLLSNKNECLNAVRPLDDCKFRQINQNELSSKDYYTSKFNCIEFFKVQNLDKNLNEMDSLNTTNIDKKNYTNDNESLVIFDNNDSCPIRYVENSDSEIKDSKNLNESLTCDINYISDNLNDDISKNIILNIQARNNINSFEKDNINNDINLDTNSVYTNKTNINRIISNTYNSKIVAKENLDLLNQSQFSINECLEFLELPSQFASINQENTNYEVQTNVSNTLDRYILDNFCRSNNSTETDDITNQYIVANNSDGNLLDIKYRTNIFTGARNSIKTANVVEKKKDAESFIGQIHPDNNCSNYASNNRNIIFSRLKNVQIDPITGDNIYPINSKLSGNEEVNDSVFADEYSIGTHNLNITNYGNFDAVDRATCKESDQRNSDDGIDIGDTVIAEDDSDVVESNYITQSIDINPSILVDNFEHDLTEIYSAIVNKDSD